MKIKTKNDLYLYKDVFGEDFFIYDDEIFYDNVSYKKNDPQNREEILLQPKTDLISAKPKKSLIKNITNNSASDDNLSTRENLKKIYTDFITTIKKGNFTEFKSIFGAGNANETETLIIYPAASEHDAQNPNKPFSDDNNKKILSLLKKSGINLKKSFIMPFFKFYTPQNNNSFLHKFSFDTTIKIIDILKPKLIICFGEHQGQEILKHYNIKTEFSSPTQTLHNLSFEIKKSTTIITYNNLDIIQSQIKQNLFLKEDLIFIGNVYRDLI